MLIEFKSPNIVLDDIIQPSEGQVQGWLNNFGSKYRSRYMDSGTSVEPRGGRHFVGVSDLAIGESSALEFVLSKLGQEDPIRRIIGYLRVGRYSEEEAVIPIPTLNEADVRAILLQYEVSDQEASKRMIVGDLVGGRLVADNFNAGVTDQLGQVLTVLGQKAQVAAIRTTVSEQISTLANRERGTRNLIWQQNGQL